MKKIFLFILMSFAAIPAFSQTRAERKAAEAEAVMRMISDTTYTINVTSALPMGWKTVHLSTYYSLEVAKDTVISCLPYFGRAYSIPYGGGKGLVFDGYAEDYTVSDGKDGSKEIEFTAMNEEDNYTFGITVFPNGSAHINVNSNKRQPISYMGRVSLEIREDREPDGF